MKLGIPLEEIEWQGAKNPIRKPKTEDPSCLGLRVLPSIYCRTRCYAVHRWLTSFHAAGWIQGGDSVWQGEASIRHGTSSGLAEC
jgi:hypothetical protein